MVDAVLEFVRRPSRSTQQQIPTAALLTGVNLPDHGGLFRLLRTKIVDKVNKEEKGVLKPLKVALYVKFYSRKCIEHVMDAFLVIVLEQF